MRKLWLGRYVSLSSVYHSLDPRAKLLMMILNIMMIIFITNWVQLLFAGCFIVIFLYLQLFKKAYMIRQFFKSTF